MGYTLSEIEQHGPITGLEWQNLAQEVIRNSHKGPGHNTLHQVLDIALRVKQWSEEKCEYLKQTYDQRNLDRLSEWYCYLNANTRRLTKKEALGLFQETLKTIDVKQGQLHPYFRIDSLFLFGSFLRPYLPTKPYGDIDFMAEWAWTGEPTVPAQERIKIMNQWLQQNPFGHFVTISMAQYAPQEAKKQIDILPENRRWQILQVWEKNDLTSRLSENQRPHYGELDRLFEPLTREEIALLHNLEKDTCAQQHDHEWRSTVLPYAERVKVQQNTIPTEDMPPLLTPSAIKKHLEGERDLDDPSAQRGLHPGGP